MARTLPVKGKTVKIRSNVNIAGLRPGQMAEVDDTQKTRDLISAGLWTLLVTKSTEPVQAPIVVEEPIAEEG